jgi:UDP-N-acetylmuramate--alanine ligase
MPLDIGTIHLIGIGGIGMSGIAEILHNLGYAVSGSDMAENANVKRLRGLGIKVHVGHDAKNIAKDIAVVVKSTAVPNSNPEIIEARAQQVPVVKRAEMLAELCRLKATVAIAGTHGKTTTTSLVSMMFESAGLEPTVINGGIINARGTNAYIGSGDWLVVEADESDGTFIRIPSTIGVISNIDPEHLDFWGDFETLKKAFRTFLENLPFYGLAVLCTDHDEVKKLGDSTTDRRIITYGIEGEPDVKAVNIRQEVKGSTFDVEVSARVAGKAATLKDVHLPMPGRHNVQNSLAAIAIGLELKVDHATIQSGFKKFGGVKRRFTITGEVDDITIVDDYGHHPTEILATLKTAKAVQEGTGGRVIAVVQPHRYSRLNHLFEEFSTCFTDADMVVVTQVYAAGEQPIEGVDADTLAARIKQHGVEASVIEGEKDLASAINTIAQPKDLVVCMGAGNISTWANALPAELADLRKK